MKTVSCLNDLREFGIDCLTGEACSLSHRILCDVTASGKKLLEKVFDVQLTLPENWNAGSSDDPHIGSIMLSHRMVQDIGIFALLEVCQTVWLMSDGTVMGFANPREVTEAVEWLKYADIKVAREFRGRRTEHYRNPHMMSGRVV